MFCKMSLNAKPIATELTPNPAIRSPGVTVGATMVTASMKPMIVTAHRISAPPTSPKFSRPRRPADLRISAPMPIPRNQNTTATTSATPIFGSNLKKPSNQPSSLSKIRPGLASTSSMDSSLLVTESAGAQKTRSHVAI